MNQTSARWFVRSDCSRGPAHGSRREQRTCVFVRCRSKFRDSQKPAARRGAHVPRQSTAAQRLLPGRQYGSRRENRGRACCVCVCYVVCVCMSVCVCVSCCMLCACVVSVCVCRTEDFLPVIARLRCSSAFASADRWVISCINPQSEVIRAIWCSGSALHHNPR